MVTTLSTVALDNDYEFEYDVTRKAATTGESEAAAGLSPTAHFSITPGGSAIGSTSTSLSERSATAGRYAGTLDAATITTDLAGYVGQTLWEVFVVSGDAETSRRVLVAASRAPA